MTDFYIDPTRLIKG